MKALGRKPAFTEQDADHIRSAYEKGVSIDDICTTLGTTRGTILNVLNREGAYSVRNTLLREVMQRGTSTREASIVYMRQKKGMTFQEIADELGVSRQRVYAIYSRAKAKGGR